MLEDEIRQKIRQLEAAREEAEVYLNSNQFEEFCDSTAVLITYWKTILKYNTN